MLGLKPWLQPYNQIYNTILSHLALEENNATKYQNNDHSTRNTSDIASPGIPWRFRHQPLCCIEGLLLKSISSDELVDLSRIFNRPVLQM